VLLRDEHAFALPEPTRVKPWHVLAAIALHVPLLFVVVRRDNPVAPLPMDQHAVSIAQPIPPELWVRRGSVPRALPRLITARPPSAVTPATPGKQSQPVTTTTVATPLGVAPAPIPVIDSAPRSSAPDMRPHYGDGRLWVQPMAEAPREIAKALSGKTAQQLTDSAVASMVQTYLDAMAREQAANPTALPSWTTKIAGKTVGLDSKWIYLGPIKVPTMLLALLPIKMNGNMSNYQYNKQLESMRADLFEAARRAATYDDFKKAIKDLHDQTERAREFKKNQRTPPDTSHHG
jgi:hypothetical protein